MDAFERVSAAVRVADLVLDLGEVLRLTTREGKRESDTTHSQMLAMVAAEVLSEKDPSSLEKILRYALIHDIPEVFAGDTPTLVPLSPEQEKEKDAREKHGALAAMALLPPRWGDFLREYQQQEDPLARFVRVLDKAMPRLVGVLNRCAEPKRIGWTKAQFQEALRRQNEKLQDYCPLPEAHAFLVEAGDQMLETWDSP